MCEQINKLKKEKRIQEKVNNINKYINIFNNFNILIFILIQ